MSLSDAVNGFSGEIAWNCADRSLFGACQLETGDQVQVVSSYFVNVIINEITPQMKTIPKASCHE